MNSIVFIGLLDDFGQNGETMKNRLFVNRFKEIYDSVFVFNPSGLKHKPWRILSLIWMVLYHCHARIFISASYGIGEPIVKLLWLLGKRNICYWMVGGTFHNKILDGTLSSEFYKKIETIIVQDEEMKQSLDKQGFNNIAYIPNSKRIDYIPIKTIRGVKTRFVFLSRIHPSKGCGEIIESVRILNSKGYFNKFYVDFYGVIDDSYKNFLNSIKDVSNISYKGFLNLNNKDGYDVLAQYDMMLFPTYWDGEGFPGVVIDAYIAGLPVLASDWNLNKNYIDDKTGIVIQHHRTDQLTDAMKMVLDGGFNIDEMSKCCQARAMNYDNRKVITKSILKELNLY